MASRAELQRLLEGILGSRNVYFQPPSNVRMKYPAIVYKLDRIENEFANNNVYRQDRRYEVTFITTDPESPITDDISVLPLCRFDRRFQSDNLYHDVFTLYF